jgi:hypothetical protein
MRIAPLVLSFVVAGSAAISPGKAASTGKRAGVWVAGSGQGYEVYRTQTQSGTFEISCDVAASLDNSRTGIYLEINGLLPAATEVDISVDGAVVRFPTDKSGGVTVSQCPGCAEKFRKLWGMIRAGRRVEVVASDGRRATFSLNGAAAVLPVEPCATGP